MKSRMKLPTMIAFLLFFAPSALSISWRHWNPFQAQNHAASSLNDQKDTRSPNSRGRTGSHERSSKDDPAMPFDIDMRLISDDSSLSHEIWVKDISEPHSRSSLTRSGARVACWPSTGGIWIKDVGLVDMEFLGLSPFEDTPRQFNKTAEDKFCTALKMVGADFWNLPLRSEAKIDGACDTLETCFDPDIKNPYLLAWPEDQMVACYIPIALAEKKDNELLGGWLHSLTMAERCDAITYLGGKRCKCKAHCPDLKNMDWSFRDPGPGGCADPGFGEEGPDYPGFNPAPTREIIDWAEAYWAEAYCARNGWARMVQWSGNQVAGLRVWR
ncbi:hypothetical protein EK21DRAFT_108535 [Setomelanomma holmii]|uniref:Uncharacterized protein n=1 Tax=Setomelanomma holmii TaxID=210430 RepID=A0A9P4HGT3_9PLEO|nr:hypothetical protein EK21DRAFT_108535 [Setomelanomma holmii]